jgi:hypothetical protein
MSREAHVRIYERPGAKPPGRLTHGSDAARRVWIERSGADHDLPDNDGQQSPRDRHFASELRLGQPRSER